MGYITNSTTDNGRQLIIKFQSSFELMGYITGLVIGEPNPISQFQSSFELMGYITTLRP